MQTNRESLYQVHFPSKFIARKSQLPNRIEMMEKRNMNIFDNCTFQDDYQTMPKQQKKHQVLGTLQELKNADEYMKELQENDKRFSSLPPQQTQFDSIHRSRSRRQGLVTMENSFTKKIINEKQMQKFMNDPDIEYQKISKTQLLQQINSVKKQVEPVSFTQADIDKIERRQQQRKTALSKYQEYRFKWIEFQTKIAQKLNKDDLRINDSILTYNQNFSSNRQLNRKGQKQLEWQNILRTNENDESSEIDIPLDNEYVRQQYNFNIHEMQIEGQNKLNLEIENLIEDRNSCTYYRYKFKDKFRNSQRENAHYKTHM